MDNIMLNLSSNFLRYVKWLNIGICIILYVLRIVTIYVNDIEPIKHICEFLQICRHHTIIPKSNNISYHEQFITIELDNADKWLCVYKFFL